VHVGDELRPRAALLVALDAATERGGPVAQRADVERELPALARAADGEGMPLVLGDRWDAKKGVVAGAPREPRGRPELDPRDPRAQGVRLDDGGLPSAAGEPEDLFDGEAEQRDPGPQEERRRVRDREDEPDDVEQVRKVKELEARRAPDDREREDPHDRDDHEERDAREPALGPEDEPVDRAGRVPAD